MRNSYALTKAEVEEEINYYKKIFTVVRILKRNQIAGICSKEDMSITLQNVLKKFNHKRNLRCVYC